MRLAELSERSGVPIASIKYYLRQGLLAPGERIGARTAEYSEDHLRRLRLVRALIHVGGLPVARVKEVLGHVDDASLGRTVRLGAALWALPQEPSPGGEAGLEDEAVDAARAEVDRLLASLGWETARQLAPISPAHAALVETLAVLIRNGFALDVEFLSPYASLMQQVVGRQLDYMETLASETERMESAVASALLFEPALRALHRLAQEEETARRYGLE